MIKEKKNTNSDSFVKDGDAVLSLGAHLHECGTLFQERVCEFHQLTEAETQGFRVTRNEMLDLAHAVLAELHLLELLGGKERIQPLHPLLEVTERGRDGRK